MSPSKVVEELRVETSRVPQHGCHLKPTMSREEARVFSELKQDRSRVILASEEGMAMVILDKQDYINKG